MLDSKWGREKEGSRSESASNVFLLARRGRREEEEEVERIGEMMRGRRLTLTQEREG